MAVGKPHCLASFLRIRARHAFHVDCAVIEKRDAVAGGALDEIDFQFRQAQLLLDGIRHLQAQFDAVTDRLRTNSHIGKGKISVGKAEPDGAGSGNGFECRRLGLVGGCNGG
ncbi:hypothetical protein D3C87_1722530 [compost metagenome]